ncbi:hypothetical protein D6833_13465 [Candidatus Parcubacteria bacterium]|nr:MAG: hypothetical protein D6833_13465 [Candidatus Parcubacteria bacterium]
MLQYAGPQFLVLFAARVFADFLLQQFRHTPEKDTIKQVLGAGFVHGLSAYLLLGDKSAIWAIPLFAVLHVCTRSICSNDSSDPRFYLLHWILHSLLILYLAVLFQSLHVTCYWLVVWGTDFLYVLIILTGFILTVFTSGIYVELALLPFLPALRGTDSDQGGLRNGGRLIGRLERALIFLFTLSGNLMAVGFLFTAKSVLRFGDLKQGSDRAEREYIIIGTLYSFFLALLIALATLSVIKTLPVYVAS